MDNGYNTKVNTLKNYEPNNSISGVIKWLKIKRAGRLP